MRLLTLFIILNICVRSLCAEDWPHWRGPRRDGTTNESSGWSEGGWISENPAWQANVGVGGTSPLVIDRRIYSFGWRDGNDTVVCIDAETGAELWTYSYPCPQHGRHATGDEGLYSGPTSTPEFDVSTGLLITLSTDGDLHALDTHNNGKPVWRINLYDEYKVERRPRVGRQARRDYGYTTAPLVVDDWVIVEVGANVGNTMAFDKRTGKRVWASENKDPAGHAGGLSPITVEGTPCIAVLTIHNLLVVRLDGERAGKSLAQYEYYTDFANSIATPAVRENFVLITSEYNHGTITKLRISLAGVEKIWEQERSSKICTPIIHGESIYWSWRGDRCLDWQTGDVRWEGGDTADAGSCIVTGDDRLITWCATGKLLLAETARRSPSAFKPLVERAGLAASDVWPHVVLADGSLLLKDRDGNLKSFKLPKQE